MRTGTKRAIWLLSLGGGAALAILLYRVWPRERLLLPRSTQVADVSTWNQGRRFYNSIGIHWLSDDTLLFDRFSGVRPNEHRTIYRYHVRNGVEEVLPDLTATREGFFTEVVDAENVSPDGRWYLCSDRWGDCLLAEVNGKRSYRYPSWDGDCYRGLYWMADSRHWLENYRVNGETHCLVLHDASDPLRSTVLPLYGHGKWYGDLDCVVEHDNAIAVVRPEDPDEEDANAEPHPDQPTYSTVYRLSLDARAKPLAQYRVETPHRGKLTHCWVSPQGDRIAWQVTVQGTEPIRALMHRLLPAIRLIPRRTVELWCSHLDGGDMHEIGHTVLSGKPEEEDNPIWPVEWLPGGKTLSYQYKDRLYTVPVD